MDRIEAAHSAPFFAVRLWSFLLGYLIWGDIARREVFIGAALIFSAGLIIIATEHFRKRPV